VPSGAKPRASFPGDSSSKSHPTFGVPDVDAALRVTSLTYALIRTLDAAIGFESAAPRMRMPY